MKVRNQVGGQKVQGVQAAYDACVTRSYGKVFRAVASRIHGKYGAVLDHAQAEDIAGEATVYALGALSKARDASSVTADAWTALAMFKARHLANSAHRRRRDGRVEALFLDAPVPGADDGLGPEAPCVAKVSEEAWLRREQDAARAADGLVLYRNLDRIFRACGVTARAGDIFRAYYLERQPLEKVSRDFQASGNVVYVTATRVLRKLGAGGRRVAQEILGDAA